ncbi:MAG: hypothetical protein ACRDTH_27580 [Pseudonocardiaceae bacterium]
MGAPSGHSTTTPTTPVESARLAAERDRPPGGPEQRTLDLRRGVAGAGQDYLDRGVLIPGHRAGVFDELTDAGLLALADPDWHGPR